MPRLKAIDSFMLGDVSVDEGDVFNATDELAKELIEKQMAAPTDEEVTAG